jgi:putative ABC transport system permease protein
MISVRTLFLFYRRHLRVQPVRELMAIAGVAAGVALLFAVEVNSRSITGSFEAIAHGVAGHASIEVAARGPEGFNERVEAQIASVPGVKATAPILQQPIIAVGPKGSRALTLVGATEELASLGGTLVGQLQRVSRGPKRGLLLLTEPTARAIGVSPGDDVAIKVAERTEHLALDATLSDSKIGALAESPIAGAPLVVVQQIAGLPHRVTRVLVEPRATRQAAVRRELIRRFGAILNVRSVTSEAGLLGNAAGPEAQLSALFSAISLLVGIILAYNALLLASGERRRFIVYLIELGTPDLAIIASLAFDALILGIAGSVLGLLIGDGVSLVAYRAVPGYIAAAFPIGGQRVVALQTVAIALGAGLFAAFAAALVPALAILRGSAEAQPGAAGSVLSLARKPPPRDSVIFTSGALLVCASVAVALLWPTTSAPALVTLIVGVVICLPAAVRYMLRLGRTAAGHSGDPAARLAVAELRTSPARSVALVATGTAAVFLMLTIGGSVADIQRAVRHGAAQTLSGADLWIKPGGPENVYATQPFAYANTQRRLEALSVVHAVYVERDSFLDLPGRRVWVIGVPPGYPTPIAASQLVHGSLASAERAVDTGGWALLSQTLASQRHLRIGERFALPTPTGEASLRLAGTISNYGWLPGTVLMNGDDYARLWGTPRASQLDVALKPGIATEYGKRAVEGALPSGSALSVQTTAERRAEVANVLGSTLSRLNDTTTVVLIAAIVSVIAMMVGAAWQRRGRLDALLSIGMSFGQLARLVFYEGGSMLLVGCLIGLASGILAQGLVDGWLHQSTGSPVTFAPAWQLGLRTILIATGISVLASMIAVVRTVGFQPRAAFSTE